MSCSPFDLKDYFLGELTPSECAAVEQHAAACAKCREELSALNLTRAALLSVPDEEPPRRIAFVSDRVFEPSWWQKLWRSGPQLGFASAAMLSAALVVHAFVPRPAAMIVPSQLPTRVATVQPAAVDRAVVERLVEAEVAKRMQTVIAESEDRQAAKLLDAVNSRLKRADDRNRELLLNVREYFERNEKRQAMMRKAAYDGVLQ